MIDLASIFVYDLPSLVEKYKSSLVAKLEISKKLQIAHFRKMFKNHVGIFSWKFFYKLA